ncbi:MAG: hypothetical protein WDO18_00915 [Acidobacteriota bacterium]
MRQPEGRARAIARNAWANVRWPLITCDLRARKYARNKINAGFANSDGCREPTPGTWNQRCFAESTPYTINSNINTIPRPEKAHAGVFMRR